ncbi:uncharacterized protein LOC133706657 [Rosa rugosa]|uniref:uncharacterized protein LOC133706657 n=1 Tax=Rosa rugosa TaxID=74645 RepID=UPI002B40516E|nr:uncharacterized protein LOC133706657 [Rosa rugosa]
MVVFFKGGVKQRLGRSISLKTKRALLDDLLLQESPGSANTARHVIIVMDAMKEFNTAPLEWALEHVIKAGSVVILLGVMPWLNIPLSSKTWLDIWPVGLEELSAVKEKIEWKSDVKYLKLQAVVDLCKNYGVVLQKKVIMGYPSRLLVVEEIISFHAKWVVFDRHQKNDRKFYNGKLPCNMVMMNEEGEADMIKGRTMIDSDVGGSTPSLLSTPILMISDHLKEFLNKPKRAREDRSRSRSQGDV